jgi:hypothetical protein
MGDVIQLPFSCSYKPVQALEAAKQEIEINPVKFLLVIGEYANPTFGGELLIVPSQLSVGDAKYLCARLREYIKENE